MPQIVPILVGIASAVSIGAGVKSLVSSPGSPQPQQQAQPEAIPSGPTPGETAAKVDADNAKQQLIARQFPNIQSQLGGSVAPDYYIEQAARDAGFPGESGLATKALSQFLGLAGDSNQTGAAAGSDIGVGGSNTNIPQVGSVVPDLFSSFAPDAQAQFSGGFQ